jgi:hypothetical protein
MIDAAADLDQFFFQRFNVITDHRLLGPNHHPGQRPNFVMGFYLH